MAVWIQLTTVLLPLLYVLLLGGYLWFFVAERSAARRWRRPLAWFTVLAHVAHVVLRTVDLGRLPLGSPLEFMSLLALTLLLIYLTIERVMGVRQTGVVVVGLSFLLQFVSSAFATGSPTESPLLSDPGYAGHALLVLMSYTALSLGFLYALIYTVQARQLSRRNFGLLFRRLPPLETLERMSVGAVRLGVPLLFMALATGHLWLYDLRDTLPPERAALLSPWDPKIIASWLVFLGYGLGLLGYDRFGWRGRRMNRVAVVTWIAVVVTMGLVHHFLPSFHDFGLRGGS